MTPAFRPRVAALLTTSNPGPEQARWQASAATTGPQWQMTSYFLENQCSSLAIAHITWTQRVLLKASGPW